ncbi:hypothetical protein L596_024163 [Steinernema carpocapsae]|uniref:Uncharacterized protein n=1 Tax=Steinernema carpocapsae TaxID=34508 RepID=A0A4U5MFX3_STECR|nr:hypothetical protein L596_024163 [Steinernema carpocapsae]
MEFHEQQLQRSAVAAANQLSLKHPKNVRSSSQQKRRRSTESSSTEFIQIAYCEAAKHTRFRNLIVRSSVGQSFQSRVRRLNRPSGETPFVTTRSAIRRFELLTRVFRYSSFVDVSFVPLFNSSQFQIQICLYAAPVCRQHGLASVCRPSLLFSKTSSSGVESGRLKAKFPDPVQFNFRMCVRKKSTGETRPPAVQVDSSNAKDLMTAEEAAAPTPVSVDGTMKSQQFSTSTTTTVEGSAKARKGRPLPASPNPFKSLEGSKTTPQQSKRKYLCGSEINITTTDSNRTGLTDEDTQLKVKPIIKTAPTRKDFKDQKETIDESSHWTSGYAKSGKRSLSANTAVSGQLESTRKKFSGTKEK